jgi:hypothetical protein
MAGLHIPESRVALRSAAATRGLTAWPGLTAFGLTTFGLAAFGLTALGLTALGLTTFGLTALGLAGFGLAARLTIAGAARTGIGTIAARGLIAARPHHLVAAPAAIVQPLLAPGASPAELLLHV